MHYDLTNINKTIKVPNHLIFYVAFTTILIVYINTKFEIQSKSEIKFKFIVKT